MKQKKPLVSIILGTRPEAIKLAPVVKIFNNSKSLNTRVIFTGQHREMVRQVMKLFEFECHKDLDIMKENQSINHITCSTLNGLNKDFQEFRPDLALIQGDTSTAFAGALSAFYEKIPVGHVEAGLRTNSINDPFPEEGNRRLISQIATLHFAPTKESKLNLINSGIDGLVQVTGNTIIDSLIMISKKAFVPRFEGIDWSSNRVLFVSVHRRENWGRNLESIIDGLNLIISSFKDVVVFLPMHPNSIVRNPLKKAFKSNKRVILSEPLDYLHLVSTIKSCYMVLTDSGGLQEEVPTLGKPVLVLRNTTERPEAIKAGTAKLIGTKSEDIFNNSAEILTNYDLYKKMSKANNPFGDGKASQRIFSICSKFLNLGEDIENVP